MRRIILRDARKIVYISSDDIQIDYYPEEQDGRYTLTVVVHKHQGVHKDNKDNTFVITVVDTLDPTIFVDTYYKLIKEFEECSPNGEVVITSPSYQAWEQEIWRITHRRDDIDLIDYRKVWSDGRED